LNVSAWSIGGTIIVRTINWDLHVCRIDHNSVSCTCENSIRNYFSWSTDFLSTIVKTNTLDTCSKSRSSNSNNTSSNRTSYWEDWFESGSCWNLSHSLFTASVWISFSREQFHAFSH
jgi:hypothetical protein